MNFNLESFIALRYLKSKRDERFVSISSFFSESSFLCFSASLFIFTLLPAHSKPGPAGEGDDGAKAAAPPRAAVAEAARVQQLLLSLTNMASIISIVFVRSQSIRSVYLTY